MRHRRNVATRLAVALGLVLSFMLASVSAAGIASAATAGEACIFNAPNGAAGLGHVGWGFRDGTGDKWVYGATENTAGKVSIPPGPPSTSQSWMDTENMADMLIDFGSGDNYDTGSGYYMTYRCISVSSSNPSAATTQAKAGDKSGYNVLTDNCLTKAIAILKSYGVTKLPSGGSTPPDTYYDSDLPASFGAQQWLTTLTIGVLLTDPLNSSYINTSPVHKQRPMHVEVFDSTGHLVLNTSATATVEPKTDRYVATVQLPGTWSSTASYSVEVQLDYTLLASPPGGATLISQGVNTTVPDTPLIVGDVNQDGQVNDTDYNLMMQCFSDGSPPTGPCSPSLKRASDLNDDGSVNGVDYNLMLRILSYLGESVRVPQR